MSEPVRLDEFRERREAARAYRREREERELVEAGRHIKAILGRLEALSASRADADRAAEERLREREQREQRRARLREAGVYDPRDGTPQAEAWARVVHARSPEEAACPGHHGSLLAMRTIASWLDPTTRHARISTIVLSGDPGTGKTVAAWYAIANAGGCLLGAGDVAPTNAWEELRARAVRTPLLVINDVSERMTTWAISAVAELIETRHDPGRRTLITTNLPERDVTTRDGVRRRGIRSLLGTRVDSRLAQGVVIPVTGADLRGRRA